MVLPRIAGQGRGSEDDELGVDRLGEGGGVLPLADPVEGLGAMVEYEGFLAP